MTDFTHPCTFSWLTCSFVCVCYSSIVTTKMLVDLWPEKKTISFAGCFLQMYFFLALATSECILFGLMAYDHCVATCNPLLYTLIMSRTACLKMAAEAFTVGLLTSVFQISWRSSFAFCSYNVIHHFCDFPSISKLSCSDTYLYEIISCIGAVVNTVRSPLVILTSYSYILFSTFCMHSREEKCKEFFTCAPHLTDNILIYSTSIYIYLRPTSSYSLTQD